MTERPESRAGVTNGLAADPYLRISAATAIRACDDLKQMLIGISEIKSASTIMCIDFPRVGTRRIGPEGEAPIFHAAKDLIELLLTDQKGIVLRRNLTVLIQEVDVYAVSGHDHLKRPPLFGRRQAQYIRQKSRGHTAF